MLSTNDKEDLCDNIRNSDLLMAYNYGRYVIAKLNYDIDI